MRLPNRRARRNHPKSGLSICSTARDPFDRLLVAQAKLEEMTLVTADPLISPYDVDQIRA